MADDFFFLVILCYELKIKDVYEHTWSQELRQGVKLQQV